MQTTMLINETKVLVEKWRRFVLLVKRPVGDVEREKWCMWCLATSQIKCWRMRLQAGMRWADASSRRALCTGAALVGHRWVAMNSQPFGASLARERQSPLVSPPCAMHVAP